jgi:transposase-like protein
MARTVRNDEAPVEDVDEPRLTVSGAARRLGIAPATLRTWDRRYGIGPTGHARGRHRRYSADDMARLEVMQRALMQGAAPAEAARYARTVALPLGEAAVKIDAALTDGTAAVADAPAPLRMAPVEVGPPTPVVRRARGGGGATLRMPGAGARARGLGRAALAMDSTAVQRLVEESIAADGLVATWDEVARPVLAAVGERWATTGRGVEVEHLLSQCLVAVFVRVAGFADAPAAPQPVRPVLLAAMPTELHVVPLAVLAALLAERGVGCRSLGAALPADALAAAVRRTAPAAVVLWSQLPSTADLGVVIGLPVTRPRCRTFVAGPGWDGAALPAGVGVLGSLVDAGDRIAGAVLR